jgi:hypothetical protein
MNAHRLYRLAVLTLVLAPPTNAMPQDPTWIGLPDREVKLNSDRLLIEAYGLSLTSAAMSLRFDLMLELEREAAHPARAPRRWLAITGGTPHAPLAVVAGVREARFDLGLGRFALVEPLVAVHTRLSGSGDLLVELERGIFANACLRGAEMFVQAVALRSCDDGVTGDLQLSHGLRLSFGRHRIDYDGPPLTADLTSTDSVPPFYNLHVSVVTPTQGWCLRHDRTIDRARVTEVYLTLEQPADQAEIAVVVPYRADLAVALGQGTRKEIHVLVSRTVRGHAYFVAPPYQLAAILRREPCQ